MNKYNAQLFFILSLISVSNMFAMSITNELGVTPCPSVPYKHALRSDIFKKDTALSPVSQSKPQEECIDDSVNRETVMLSHASQTEQEQEILDNTVSNQSLKTITKDERIENCGNNLLFGLTASMVYSGNYIYALGTGLAAACIKAPQKVDAAATHATLLSAVAYEKASQHINKENCERAMSRCPNSCQKFASILTFGYYKPIEQVKLRTRKIQ